MPPAIAADIHGSHCRQGGQVDRPQAVRKPISM
jgi:hypothetical protein